MKNLVCIFVLSLVGLFAFSGVADATGVQRSVTRQRIVGARVPQRHVERVVVREQVVNHHHHANVELVRVPRREVRFVEVPHVKLQQDSYGERIIVREQVIAAPQKHTLRLEVQGSHECEIEVEQLRKGY